MAFLHGLYHSSSDKSVEKLPAILHPLFQTFMTLKWRTVRKYEVLEVITHFLLVVFITIVGVQYAVHSDCNYIKEPKKDDCPIKYDYRQYRYNNETQQKKCIRQNELCFKNDYYDLKFENGTMLSDQKGAPIGLDHGFLSLYSQQNRSDFKVFHRKIIENAKNHF